MSVLYYSMLWFDQETFMVLWGSIGNLVAMASFLVLPVPVQKKKNSFILANQLHSFLFFVHAHFYFIY